MGRPTKMRAASAASADEAEAQQAISLASARPSSPPEQQNRLAGCRASLENRRDNAAAQARRCRAHQDAARRLRAACAPRQQARPKALAGPSISCRAAGCAPPQPAGEGRHRSAAGCRRRLAARTHTAANDQHRGRHQCAPHHAARADRRRDRRRLGRHHCRHAARARRGADEDRQPARRTRTPRRPAPPHQPARERTGRSDLPAQRPGSDAQGSVGTDAGVHGRALAPAGGENRRAHERDRRSRRQPAGSRARAGAGHAAGRVQDDHECDLREGAGAM